ncbi:hypothetical protein PVAND_003672 [Polypedilum vanderplanki]|uniref:NADH dehydrogenase [ubiquinone] flavoprotein 3, mitochondrial n=1 Tax=Polypedilum vanderplanki TaxID=319348 RepID=A0A9J6BVT3_POLVA|nr:hypothetical protein PVAND_003672 [Polypedilum vanderplanki]
MFRRLLSNLPTKSLKMPLENYLEPETWNLNFEKPSQVRSRAFMKIDTNSNDKKIGKDDKLHVYKNPEYFSYHQYSYYNIEEDLCCKRCRSQPSPKNFISQSQ